MNTHAKSRLSWITGLLTILTAFWWILDRWKWDWDRWMWGVWGSSLFMEFAIKFAIFGGLFAILFYLTFRLSGRNKKCWLLLLFIPIGFCPFPYFFVE